MVERGVEKEPEPGIKIWYRGVFWCPGNNAADGHEIVKSVLATKEQIEKRSVAVLCSRNHHWQWAFITRLAEKEE